MEKAQKIWMDGKLVAWEDAKVHVLTHTLHYGVGVFEGIRYYKTGDNKSAVFRLRDHIRRLFDSAHLVLMEIPYSQETLFEATLETIRANDRKDGYIRPLAYYGSEMMGLGSVNPVHVAIAVYGWGAYLGEEGLKKGIRAKVSSFPRMSVSSFTVKAKVCGQYVNSVLAKREVALAGYDEAIMLDQQGFVCEASGENIFMVKDQVVITPPMSSAILGGITRRSVLKMAYEKGYKILEARFTRDALYMADEVFFTGTAAEITPVREVDNRRIGAGMPGPITRSLQETFFRVVRGDEPRWREWLTYV